MERKHLKSHIFLEQFKLKKTSTIFSEIQSAIDNYIHKNFIRIHPGQEKLFCECLNEYFETLRELLINTEPSQRGLILRDILYFLSFAADLETDGTKNSANNFNKENNAKLRKLLKTIDTFLNAANNLDKTEQKFDGLFFSKAIHPSKKNILKSNLKELTMFYEETAASLNKSLSSGKGGPKKRKLLGIYLKKLDVIFEALIRETKYRSRIQPLQRLPDGTRDHLAFAKTTRDGKYAITSKKMIVNGLYLTGLTGSYKEADIHQILLKTK